MGSAIEGILGLWRPALMCLLGPHSPKTRAIICHKLTKIHILKFTPVDVYAIEIIVFKMAKRNLSHLTI